MQVLLLTCLRINSMWVVLLHKIVAETCVFRVVINGAFNDIGLWSSKRFESSFFPAYFISQALARSSVFALMLLWTKNSDMSKFDSLRTFCFYGCCCCFFCTLLFSPSSSLLLRSLFTMLLFYSLFWELKIIYVLCFLPFLHSCTF